VRGEAPLGRVARVRNPLFPYFFLSAACAAASRAIGTRYGEALT